MSDECVLIIPNLRPDQLESFTSPTSAIKQREMRLKKKSKFARINFAISSNFAESISSV